MTWDSHQLQFSSVQSLSRVQLFPTPWTSAHQASLSVTNSRSLLRLMSIESVVPYNHLIPCHPFLLPPSIFPSIRFFSNELVLRISLASHRKDFFFPLRIEVLVKNSFLFVHWIYHFTVSWLPFLSSRNQLSIRYSSKGSTSPFKISFHCFFLNNKHL